LSRRLKSTHRFLRRSATSAPRSRSATYECAWRFYREWLATQQIDVTAVRPKHIVSYLEKLRADGQVKASIGRALTVIRSIYARVVTDEHMPTNPAREVKGPKVDGSAPKAPVHRQRGRPREAAECARELVD
jgi:site-specific recombinase XerD